MRKGRRVDADQKRYATSSHTSTQMLFARPATLLLRVCASHETFSPFSARLDFSVRLIMEPALATVFPASGMVTATSSADVVGSGCAFSMVVVSASGAGGRAGSGVIVDVGGERVDGGRSLPTRNWIGGQKMRSILRSLLHLDRCLRMHLLCGPVDSAGCIRLRRSRVGRPRLLGRTALGRALVASSGGKRAKRKSFRMPF